MEIKFRTFDKKDLSAVQDLQIESMRRLSNGHYTNEQLAAEEKVIRNSEYLNELLPINLTLAFADRELIASAGWNQHEIQTARIRKVFVSPNHAQRGLGSLMLRRIEVEIRHAGFNKIFCRASMNAVPFYKKAGFYIVKQDEMKVASNLSMPVMLMEKALDGL